jgi:transposase
VAPLVELLTPLNAAIAAANARVARRAAADSVPRRLATVPGVGPVTAVAFRATLDDVARFARPGQVGAYVGLVPREHSSGDRQRRGAITKAGNTRLRWLLVQAAWGIWRDRHAASLPLRTWAQRLAARRRKGIAVVALARRLAGICPPYLPSTPICWGCSALAAHGIGGGGCHLRGSSYCSGIRAWWPKFRSIRSS